MCFLVLAAKLVTDVRDMWQISTWMMIILAAKLVTNFGARNSEIDVLLNFGDEMDNSFWWNLGYFENLSKLVGSSYLLRNCIELPERALPDRASSNQIANWVIM